MVEMMVKLAVGFLMLTAVACQSVGEDDSSPSPVRVGFSQCCDDKWRDVMNREVERTINTYPELTLLRRAANSNSDQQIRQIEELVAGGIDILLVSPNESEPLVPVLEKVYKSGIPVVLIDRKIESSLYTAYIGADNYEVGRVAGRYLAGQKPGGGNILTIEIPPAMSPGLERSRGFRDGISDNPNFRIVSTLQDDLLTAKPDTLGKVLRQHPEIDIVYSHTDGNAEYAYTVARELGVADSMYFIGIDGIVGSGRGIKAVQDGILDASVLYPTGGEEAVKLVYSIVNGLPYQKENTLETIVIEPRNAAILYNQMQRVNELQDKIDEETRRLASLQTIYRNQQLLIGILVATILVVLTLAVSLFRSLRSKNAALASLHQRNQVILDNERQLQQLAVQLAEADEEAFNEDKPFDVEYFISRIQKMLRQEKTRTAAPPQRTPARLDPVEAALSREDISAEDREFLRRLASYVERHYSDSDFKATHLCRELGTSRSRLYRKVKELLDEGVTGYVERVRISHAERLLVDTDQSIADIAYAVGYSTPEYFAKVFKSRTDLSPTSYREKIRELLV